MSLKARPFAATLLVATAALIPLVAAAQPASLKDGRLTTAECGALGILCGTGSTFFHVSVAVWNIILAFLTLTAVVAAGVLIYSGVQYIISRGNEENTRKAKMGITYAILGLVIIGIAGFLVNAVIGVATP